MRIMESVSTGKAFRLVIGIALALCLSLSVSVSVSALSFAQSAPKPSGGTAPIIDNERVTVWEVTWTPGNPAIPVPRADEDHVVVYLAPTAGEVVFRPKGTPIM